MNLLADTTVAMQPTMSRVLWLRSGRVAFVSGMAFSAEMRLKSSEMRFLFTSYTATLLYKYFRLYRY